MLAPQPVKDGATSTGDGSLGAGSIGQAIARRVSAGKHVVLADLREENAEAAAAVLGDAGFTTTTA